VPLRIAGTAVQLVCVGSETAVWPPKRSPRGPASLPMITNQVLRQLRSDVPKEVAWGGSQAAMPAIGDVQLTMVPVQDLLSPTTCG
jgi:hypothetical protein